MYGLIQKRAKKIADTLAGKPDYFFISSHHYSLLPALKPVLKQYARGRLLDVGAGRLTYKPLLERFVREYVSLDVERRTEELDYVADARKMPLEDGSFDTVFCSQVLEHVSEPELVLKEISRVLRPGGHLIVTVPHISYLHNEPNDYFRFTKYGLSYILEKSGLKPLLVEPAGGFVSLLGDLPSKIIVPLSFFTPVLGKVIFAVNRLWVKGVVFFDERVEKRKLFALCYVAVAQKCKR